VILKCCALLKVFCLWNDSRGLQFASFEEESENVGWKMADLSQNSMHHFEYLASPTFHTYGCISLLCV